MSGVPAMRSRNMPLLHNFNTAEDETGAIPAKS